MGIIIWGETQNNYQQIHFRNIVDTWENYGNNSEYTLCYISTEMYQPRGNHVILFNN